MKTTKLLLSSLCVSAILLLAASCEKWSSSISSTGELIKLSASIEQADELLTKTLLGETVTDNTPILWTYDAGDASKCDKIKVYALNTSQEFTVSAIDPQSKKATFTGTAPAGGAITSAIYPSSMGAATENTIVIPSSQKYNASNVADGTMPMYAQVSGGSSTLNFKNLCGIVKLQLTQETGKSGQRVRSIVLTLADDIAGTASITYNGGAPTLAFTSGQSKTITLDCGTEGVALSATATSFHIVVPPTTATTFIIKVILTDGSAMIKTAPENVANKINRSKIKTMNSISFSKTYMLGEYYDEYGINHGKGITLSLNVNGSTKNITWAPVNCGYKAKTGNSGEALGYPHGKLYQWGRQYGQGYSGELYINGNQEGTISDAITPNMIEGQVSFSDGNSAANKNNFYCGKVNWCTESFSEWSHSKGNDPCPEGWRLPTKNELESLSKGKRSGFIADDSGLQGYYFTGDNDYSAGLENKVFFPAAGFRSYSDGSAYDRGSIGGYWSSSAYSENDAPRLGFYYGDVNVLSFDRADGYSVRCVEDL